MNPGTLFGRRVEVLIGTASQPAMASYGNVGLESSPLRIGFEVKKNLKSSPNTATVTIYNLSGTSRTSLYPGMYLTLSAGYRDGLQTLFVGVVDKAKSARQGADIATTIECLDGGTAITQSVFHHSYGPGMRLTDVLSDVARQMQLVTAANPYGISAGASLGIPDDVFTQGYAAHGMCRDILDTLCKPRGLEWSIQDGALQIIPKTGHTGETAEVVSHETGLLGVPSLNKELCEFTTLLNPRIAPGRLVQLDTREISGIFKVRGGTWSGDTHEPKWQAAIEALHLPNAAQILPSAEGFRFGEGTLPV